MSLASPTETTSGTATAEPPAGPAARDNRAKLLEATMKRHQYGQDALIEVLHKAQELYGYLEPPLLRSIAAKLGLPPSRVYGVATFYHFFSLQAKGRHTCVVCLGTACYVKGAQAILSALEEASGLRAGTTSEDGGLSLLSARCLGACGIAPAVVFDGAVVGHQTADGASELVKGWLQHGAE